jgi:hypothetical protein
MTLHAERPLSKGSPPGIASLRSVVLLPTATAMVPGAPKASPEQLADPGKCVAYDVQHDAITRPGFGAFLAGEAARIKR